MKIELQGSCTNPSILLIAFTENEMAELRLAFGRERNFNIKLDESPGNCPIIAILTPIPEDT